MHLESGQGDDPASGRASICRPSRSLVGVAAIGHRPRRAPALRDAPVARHHHRRIRRQRHRRNCPSRRGDHRGGQHPRGASGRLAAHDRRAIPHCAGAARPSARRARARGPRSRPEHARRGDGWSDRPHRLRRRTRDPLWHRVARLVDGRRHRHPPRHSAPSHLGERTEAARQHARCRRGDCLVDRPRRFYGRALSGAVQLRVRDLSSDHLGGAEVRTAWRRDRELRRRRARHLVHRARRRSRSRPPRPRTTSFSSRPSSASSRSRR